jgi:hypothetical protein
MFLCSSFLSKRNAMHGWHIGPLHFDYQMQGSQPRLFLAQTYCLETGKKPRKLSVIPVSRKCTSSHVNSPRILCLGMSYYWERIILSYSLQEKSVNISHCRLAGDKNHIPCEKADDNVSFHNIWHLLWNICIHIRSLAEHSGYWFPSI